MSTRELWTHILPHGTCLDPSWQLVDFSRYRCPHDYVKFYWTGLHGWRRGCKTAITINGGIYNISCACDKSSSIEYKILEK